MSYMTDKNFEEMISFIIKEDEKLRSKEQEIIKVNFEAAPPNIPKTNHQPPKQHRTQYT